MIDPTPNGTPVPARSPDLNPAEFSDALIGLFSDHVRNRVVDLYRLDELYAPAGPFSHSWLKDRLRDGTLEGVAIRGVRLVTGESLRRMIESAETWSLK